MRENFQQCFAQMKMVPPRDAEEKRRNWNGGCVSDMCLKIEGAVVTHVGNVRSGNEDNYYLFGNYRYDTAIRQKRESKTVLAQQMAAAVYDGMGGEEAGEMASYLAVKECMPCALDEMDAQIRRQISAANMAVCREIKHRGTGRMGTTIAALYMDENTAISCNVGDSRCYTMHKGILRQISVDDSEARAMVEMGLLSPENARSSKSWHKLTQHLGVSPDEFIIEPHISAPMRMETGDIFLLCSDGLTDMVMDETIGEILSSTGSAMQQADTLVETALENGGRDNITVVVLHVKSSKGNQIPALLRKVPTPVWILLFFLIAAAVIIA